MMTCYINKTYHGSTNMILKKLYQLQTLRNNDIVYEKMYKFVKRVAPNLLVLVAIER